MPALAATHDEDEVRDVAAFVVKLGAMSKDDYATLRKKHRSDKHQSMEGLKPRVRDLAGDRMANERR